MRHPFYPEEPRLRGRLLLWLAKRLHLDDLILPESMCLCVQRAHHCVGTSARWSFFLQQSAVQIHAFKQFKMNRGSYSVFLCEELNIMFYVCFCIHLSSWIYADIRKKKKNCPNIEIWISTVSSSPGPQMWSMCDWRQTNFKQLWSQVSKCTVQMFLDSCQFVAYLQERVRNNLTGSFQSSVFEGLPWAFKTVPIVKDNTTQMRQAVNLKKYYLFYLACRIFCHVCFYSTVPHVSMIKKRQLTCCRHPDISPTVFELLCVYSVLIKYSITLPAPLHGIEWTRSMSK